MAGTLLVILCMIWVYQLYQQPRERLHDKDAAYVVTAIDLYNAFETNETVATNKYVDKIIVVSGTVKEVIETQDHVTVKLETGSDAAFINADIDKRNLDQEIIIGNSVSIKGRCTGFLNDVYLADCIIENKKRIP